MKQYEKPIVELVEFSPVDLIANNPTIPKLSIETDEEDW